MDNLEALKEQANKLFIGDEILPNARSFKYYLEARYKGESYELRIALPGQIKCDSLVEFIVAFHAEHKKEFGYELVERPIEIVNLRLEAVGKTSKPIADKVTQN